MGLRDIFGLITGVNQKAEVRGPKEIRNPKAERTIKAACKKTRAPGISASALALHPGVVAV
jgi:hypothetical protein